MTRAAAQTITVTMQYRKEIIRAFLAVCAFLVILYAVNVYSALSDSVALQNAELQIAELSKTVEDLDAQYLTLSSTLTPDKFQEYGLSQGKVSAFITKSASIGRAAFAGNDL